jgi:deferrochelatase/peroxidase EfeB
MTFNLTTSKRSELQTLLALWSSAIAQMMKGEPISEVEPKRPFAIGLDTGEALDLGPASLTVTVGLGPRVFTDTYDLAHRKPTLLRQLKAMPGDNLNPETSEGDLSLQACADDPQVAYHAIRDLARIAKRTGAAETRWAILGFGRASAGKNQHTPRNLFGFRDGTRNIRTDEEFNQFVWVHDGPDWQRLGSYQVVRQIQMRIENWDVDQISDQTRIFGRHKVSGAPLTGTHEFDTPDFKARDKSGELIIDAASHIHLAAHENNGGTKILRRPYSYTMGINQFGVLDAGLLFLTYQNAPAHFEKLQTKLGAADLLNEYITHLNSGVFFVPPAPKEGSYIAEGMFS